MKLSRALLAFFFVVAGANHFLAPHTYLQIVPPFLPAREAAIYLSGAAEIAGGLGLLFSRTRRPAAIGLILLLLAVFPANVYGALHGMNLHGWAVPSWLLWLRLPFQPLLLAWVYFAGWNADKPPR